MFRGSFLSLEETQQDHHASIQSLEQAANKNCVICKDVWKDLVKRSDSDRETFHVDATREDYVTKYSIGRGCVSVSLYGCPVHSQLLLEYVETQRKSASRPSRV